MQSSVGLRSPRLSPIVGKHGYHIAIFDLDRTLLPGSSLVCLGRALVREEVIERRHLLRHVLWGPLFSRLGLGDDRISRLRESLLSIAAGREHADLLSVIGSLAPNLASRLYPAARWLVGHHLDAGHFCVLLSSAPQELVEAVSTQLGTHRGLGTRPEVVDGRLTGRLSGPFCYGAGKLERLLAELGDVDFANASAYSDSASDLPLLSACGRPVAVNPDRHLRHVARTAGWPILRFS
ncbi:MAG: HAD-IB family hydrolase [Actinomycetota bacterium]|nr:HAD-IB family hydrolase [Actinomycetota bacterium]